MSFWRNINPSGAVADFWTVFRGAGRYRWRFAALAAAVTIGIFSVMWQEEMRGPPARPKITYITSWSKHRTDAEIVASNIANQKRKDALAAEEAKREEYRRDIYKTLGRVSGMDVDAIEKEALAEQAAEKRAADTQGKKTFAEAQRAKANGQ